MGMLETPGTLRAGSIKMDANATGGGDSIGNSLSQKFSFVDSVPATDGLDKGSTYTYTITGSDEISRYRSAGYSFYYAKLTLSGKDLEGLHRTAEIEVFNGKLQSLFLSNINGGDIDVAVYGDIVRVTSLFTQTWFFTNHVEGYTGTLGGGFGQWGSRAVQGGGNTAAPAYLDTMDYFNIGVLGDAADFGNLTVAREYLAAEGDGSRGTNIAGRGGASAYQDHIDYFAIRTLGNAVDFGEVTQARLLTQAAGDSNRAVTVAGHTGAFQDIMDCFTFQSLGDATDFGELSLARHSPGACSNGSRGMYAGGEQPTQSPIDPDLIDYITIGTFCDALDWGGEMTTGRRQSCSASNGDRGVWMGGYTASPTAYYDTIDYVNIGIPTMDAIDFGELTATTNHSGAGSDGSRAVRTGGGISTVPTYDTIDYITIATKGDASDFGELTQSRFGLAARAPSGD